MHPPFDPELVPLMMARRSKVPRIALEELSTLRASSATRAVPLEQLESEYELQSTWGPSRDGAEIPLLIVRPRGVTGELPCLYYMHGGGMITGNNRLGIDRILALQAVTPMTVVSVEYRLAPEYPHPVPFSDCWDGLEWVVAHASELDIDLERLLVAGMSAGGGLAAAVALHARDAGGPRFAGQLLVSPMLDDRGVAPSSTELVDEGVWDGPSNQFGWRSLLGDAVGGPDVPPEAAPIRASDLSGLPPTFLDVGSVETFRDEVLDYAARIWQAGGDAELHVWPGAFHGYDGAAPGAQLSLRAKRARAEWLARLWKSPLSREVIDAVR